MFMMGQSLSGHASANARTNEEMRKQLAHKFAEKCFTSIEMFCLKETFRNLADIQQNTMYLSEDTIARFLEIPDVLEVSPILYHMASFLGSFPFLNDAPVILELEEVVIITSLLTERYKTILSKGAIDRRKLLFKSLAVHDRQASKINDEGENKVNKREDDNELELGTAGRHTSTPGFAIDEGGEDEPEDEGDGDDDLILSALESLGAIDDAFRLGNKETLHGAMIPADNLRRLITLLLISAPLGSQDRLSQFPLDIDSLRSAADSILAAFLNVEQSPGVKFRAFNNVLPVCFEHMFDGLSPLFEHFLFSKSLEFTKKGEKPATTGATTPIAPLLPEKSNILNQGIISQMSFFIPGSELFRRLRLLYSGDNDGFSMGSFESSVFNWRAPTILLVKGTRCADSINGNEERFSASLPPKRYPDGSSCERLTFGLFLRQPWRHTNKECFGDTDSILFQLEPVHDVFPASHLNKDYVSFSKTGTSSTNTGIAVGNPPPKPSASYGRQDVIHLGPVSLLLNDGFEFGVFTHDYTSRGGAFQSSVSRKFNFQDRFEVENLEVWGCGGVEEAKGQAERWAFEAREAEARRRINLGTGDIEADRALLEMAGLVGGNRSGGSMA